MRNNAVIKLVLVAGIAIAFIVPLEIISGVIGERSGYRDRVTREVAETTAGEQRIMGPFLALRYRVRSNPAGSQPGVRVEEQLLLPDSLTIRSSAHVESRQRGIYRVPVFRSTNHLRANFAVPENYGIPAGLEVVGAPEIALCVGVSDARGIRAAPVARLDGVPIAVRSGTGSQLPQGFSMVPSEPLAGRRVAVDVDFDLWGTSYLGFAPAGSNSVIELDADWPHPGFSGGFLPDERTITSKGFQARWRLSRFATGIQGTIVDSPVARLQSIASGAKLVQPVDVYQQSQRAVKYGMLFVLLTFVTFFMVEVLRRLAIHPIQYTLCAAALVIFFLLLVSLSEHIPFAAAYVVGSAACVGLLAFYLGHALGSAMRGLAIAAMISVLYGLLYVILLSEDYALLLGSLLLFGTLATVMVMTRRVDWYRLGETARAEPERSTPMP